MIGRDWGQSVTVIGVVCKKVMPEKIKGLFLLKIIIFKELERDYKS